MACKKHYIVSILITSWIGHQVVIEIVVNLLCLSFNPYYIMDRSSSERPPVAEVPVLRVSILITSWIGHQVDMNSEEIVIRFLFQSLLHHGQVIKHKPELQAFVPNQVSILITSWIGHQGSFEILPTPHDYSFNPYYIMDRSSRSLSCAHPFFRSLFQSLLHHGQVIKRRSLRNQQGLPGVSILITSWIGHQEQVRIAKEIQVCSFNPYYIMDRSSSYPLVPGWELPYGFNPYYIMDRSSSSTASRELGRVFQFQSLLHHGQVIKSQIGALKRLSVMFQSLLHHGQVIK